jgi:hypothetical protein
MSNSDVFRITYECPTCARAVWQDITLLPGNNLRISRISCVGIPGANHKPEWRLIVDITRTGERVA